MTKHNLVRDTRYKLFMVDNNAFDVVDKNDNTLLSSKDNYFIYLQNVNFKRNGVIEGRYLGDLTSNSPLLDKNCKTVSINGDKFTVDNDQIMSARMVAINNKDKVIVIIARD